MELERGVVAPPQEAEVPMVEAEVVQQMRHLDELGWGSKRIARELGVARNTVRRYLRDGAIPGVQVREEARAIDAVTREQAAELFVRVAEGNAVVVRDLLAERGVQASVRTVQRVVRPAREQLRAKHVATVRFETEPGHQLQIDFGQKRVRLGQVEVVVHLFVAVLSHSRRIFVKAFLSERQDDWLEGIAEAFRHFGGVPRQLLVDNPKAFVTAIDVAAAKVTFHPAFVGFCRDWEVEVRACRPYRARTKGKTESGVKYVKRNALAGRSFESFDALVAHLDAWMARADAREHGTTHERPLDRFERDERAALRPLPTNPLPARNRRLRRKVANDCFVDVDTVRYSVPHRLVRDHVEVHVGEQLVRIFHGTELVATHRRSLEPHRRVVDPAHYAGLWRQREAPHTATGRLEELGRSLADYADVVEQGAA